MRNLSKITARFWAVQSSTSSLWRNGASLSSGFKIIHLFPGLVCQMVTEMKLLLPVLVRVCPLLPHDQISKNTCFFPSSSVFVRNFSSILPPFPSSTFVCSLTVLLLSCLDGGRDGQQGFQENKDQGASHCRLPGLCQRKQGRTGECVTTRMCTNTP